MTKDDDRDWKPGARLETRRFDMGPCLNCAAPLTGIIGPADDPAPDRAVMVCAYCGHIMEWTGKALAELSDQAQRDIAGDPDVIAAVELTDQFRRAGPFAFCAACGAQTAIGRLKCQRCGQPLVFEAGAPR